MDDIVIKSRKMADFVKDLEETLYNRRRVGLKLNPSKCTFGVKSGKFLGHIVSHRGLQGNPEKASVFGDMKSLKNIREVQALMGQLAVLGQFLSRVVDK